LLDKVPCVDNLIIEGTTLSREDNIENIPEEKLEEIAVEYLSKVLPPAVICMLVVYCFKSVNVLSSPFGLPELIAGLTVVVLHIWKRNNLLSIGAGTIIYMILVQTVFV